MRLSEERIQKIAVQIADTLLDEEHVDLVIAEDRFTHLIESKITELLRVEDEIDEEAAAWIHLNKSYLEDGTPEFEVELEKVKKNLADSKGYVLY
ncbi:DUF507 family protein [bacterium]|nr:DUF507 family protein [bacterium]MBU1074407.1 DUF507 family protein [bacterium]MBU1676295.1 DUF507 family protein [bacterium]